MTDLPKECGHCGRNSLYVTRTASGGGYGPTLLPGLGGFLRFAKFDVVLCTECGHTVFFAEPGVREKAMVSPKWRRVSP